MPPPPIANIDPSLAAEEVHPGGAQAEHGVLEVLPFKIELQFCLRKKQSYIGCERMQINHVLFFVCVNISRTAEKVH